MKEFKNEKGVSLIALIIFLVMILLAAGIIVVMVISTNKNKNNNNKKDDNNTIENNSVNVATENVLSENNTTENSVDNNEVLIPPEMPLHDSLIDVGYFEIEKQNINVIVTSFSELEDYIRMFIPDGGRSPLLDLKETYNDQYFKNYDLAFTYVVTGNGAIEVSIDSTNYSEEKRELTINYKKTAKGEVGTDVMSGYVIAVSDVPKDVETLVVNEVK